jgi:hypothetical protein
LETEAPGREFEACCQANGSSLAVINRHRQRAIEVVARGVDDSAVTELAVRRNVGSEGRARGGAPTDRQGHGQSHGSRVVRRIRTEVIPTCQIYARAKRPEDPDALLGDRARVADAEYLLAPPLAEAGAKHASAETKSTRREPTDLVGPLVLEEGSTRHPQRCRVEPQGSRCRRPVSVSLRSGRRCTRADADDADKTDGEP